MCACDTIVIARSFVGAVADIDDIELLILIGLFEEHNTSFMCNEPIDIRFAISRAVSQQSDVDSLDHPRTLKNLDGVL